MFGHGRCMASPSSRRHCCFALALTLGLSLGLMLSVGPEAETEGGCVYSGPKDTEAGPAMEGDLRAGPVGPNDKVLELLQGHHPPQLILVGVMTAQKYLDTRAPAVYDTWARSLPGHVVFFAGARALAAPHLPVVRLPGVDDAYPPQKKSFLMLKFLSEHFLGRYEWFMRADDDVYVRGDALGPFLRSINSSRPQFIGQAGVGNKDEFGLLNLRPEDNFCMGGPGIVMSAETLRLVGPNVRHCLKNLYSTHEDVEVGRCVRHFAGIPCTWSYEMQTIFYHNSSGEAAFTGNLKQREIHRAITLHPVKQHQHFYRLHNYFTSLKMRDLLQANLELHRDIRTAMERLKYDESKGDAVDAPHVDGRDSGAEAPLNLEAETHSVAEAPLGLEAETQLLSRRFELPVVGSSWELGKPPGLIKTRPRNDSEVLKWEFVHRAIYSHAHSNPRRGVNGVLSETLNDVVSQIMDRINRFAKQRGRLIDFKDILYAYSRLDPRHGQDYVLDLLLVYKKYRGRKMTLPVRKHVYVQQAFTALQLRSLSSPGNESGKRVNFILPLAGRLKIFQRFADNFEKVCLAGSEPFSVSLSVVLFPENEDGNEETFEKVEEVLENLRNKYGKSAEFHLIRRFEAFSRARALELGSERFLDEELLLFIDVDMVFDEGFVHRVITRSVRREQAYFPIVFSQFDPQFVGPNRDLTIDEALGYWRVFGFGIVGLHKGDLISVGGLDTEIKGWGQEDVDLYDKVIRSPMRVFRAPDPGLTHVFHSIECDEHLPPTQLTMCRGSKASSVGPVQTLATLLYKHPELIQASHLGALLKDDEDNSERHR